MRKGLFKMNSKILARIIGFVILILAVLMIFDFYDTLTIKYLSKLSRIQSNPMFISKALLELISAIFLLISGTEILKGNERGQKFLIIGTLTIFIKSLLYFEVRNYTFLILLIFICVFRFLLKLKK